jgi:hypothetical protein
MNKEQGFVSIITASIVMIIITLVVIGFSQVMQREQRQSLDRQLSSQAAYAAETAVNDVYAQLQSGALVDEEKPDCDVSSFPNGGVVNPGSNNEAAYTCVTFDQTPEFLEFNNGSITTQQSKIFPLQPKSVDDSALVSSLRFSWNGARGETSLTLPNNPNTLPTNAASTGVPILRVDLVRLPLAQPVSRDTLIEETTTFFLYPTSSTSNNAGDYASLIGLANKGTVIPVYCDETQAYACVYELENMDTSGQESNRYIARIKSIYNDADLLIEGESTGPGRVFEFIGAQIFIDATGKSNDVLRRISVQIANPSYPIPEFVVQGLDGICKGITIAPTFLAEDSCF